MKEIRKIRFIALRKICQNLFWPFFQNFVNFDCQNIYPLQVKTQNKHQNGEQQILINKRKRFKTQYTKCF